MKIAKKIHLEGLQEKIETEGSPRWLAKKKIETGGSPRKKIDPAKIFTTPPQMINGQPLTGVDQLLYTTKNTEFPKSLL